MGLWSRMMRCWRWKQNWYRESEMVVICSRGVVLRRPVGPKGEPHS